MLLVAFVWALCVCIVCVDYVHVLVRMAYLQVLVKFNLAVPSRGGGDWLGCWLLDGRGRGNVISVDGSGSGEGAWRG